MLARFWALIDSETVRLYQAVMYTCYAFAGIYMASYGRPPSTVQRAMGEWAHTTWVVLMVTCPLLVLLGARFFNRDSGARNRYSGLWLQLGGNLGVTLALAAYVASVLKSPWWGTGVFAVWGYAGLTICNAVIVLRDARRIRQAGELAKELLR